MGQVLSLANPSYSVDSFKLVLSFSKNFKHADCFCTIPNVDNNDLAERVNCPSIAVSDTWTSYSLIPSSDAIDSGGTHDKIIIIAANYFDYKKCHF